MPSRPVTLAIVVFWLAAAGWMVYRELWQPAGQAPPFALDIADEVGIQAAAWEVRCAGKWAGSARTSVRRTGQRLLELHCLYTPDNFSFRGLTVKNLSSVYRATPKGAQRELTASVTLALFGAFEYETKLSGRSEGGFFTPLLSRLGAEGAQAPVEVGPAGRVLNVLHPLHKMAGLRPGRSWRVPLLDPLAVAAAGPRGQLLPSRMAEARVDTETLNWNGAQVPCWRVAYREEGGDVSARLWARVSDGVVLRHEAGHGETAIVLQRKPNP